MFDGRLKRGVLWSLRKVEKFTALEVGTFSPQPKATPSLGEGSIGYVVTGIKEPGFARVGDTIRLERSNIEPLPGYGEPKPVVWASIYPESQDDFPHFDKHSRDCDSQTLHFRLKKNRQECLGEDFVAGSSACSTSKLSPSDCDAKRTSPLLLLLQLSPTKLRQRIKKKRIIYSPSLFPTIQIS
jgi:translation elongation factor EF-4